MASHPFDWSTWGRLDATELAARLRTKDVTVSEVMHQFADAISLQNPHLNAVIEVFNDVLDDPDSSGANPDGAFYGVPIMIKDMGSRIKGRDQQIGLGFKAPELATEDDPLIENFRAAGFIVCGRTAVPEDGMTLITTVKAATQEALTAGRRGGGGRPRKSRFGRTVPVCLPLLNPSRRRLPYSSCKRCPLSRMLRHRSNVLRLVASRLKSKSACSILIRGQKHGRDR